MGKLERINIRDEMPEKLNSAREELIKILEDGAEGLDVKRVNEFINSLGLEPRELLFVKSNKQKQANNILKPFGSSLEFFEQNIGGQYLPYLVVSLVKRVSDGYGKRNKPLQYQELALKFFLQRTKKRE